MAKAEVDEEAQAFLDQPHDSTPIEHPPRTTHGSRLRAWKPSWLDWRLCAEALLFLTVVYLLFFKPPPPRTIRRTPVPEFPRKITTFHTNPTYTRPDMFTNESTTLHTLHAWIPLSSASRGYIPAPSNLADYDLPPPTNIALDRHTDGPGYMVSVFHQLHCLSYLAEHFSRGYARIALEPEVGEHAAHCFDYLRQAIMCAADTTLEGHTDAGPGEGSEHECVDYDALLAWANEHAAYRWRNSLLPEDSVL